MAQSPEYPDLRWMPPKSWQNANRRSVQLIVIHDTEGSEGPTSAEDGAAYDQRRDDGTSTHYFHDSNSTVQCVRTEDIAHAARHQGNLRGIQHELCGKAGQTAAQWTDAASEGMLRQAARQCARDAKKWGIPVRHLTVAQVAAGAKGFCGHWDITRAFPQDDGDHTDPGPNFPWSRFLDMVRAELEDDMTPDQMTAWARSADGKDALADAILAAKLGSSGPTAAIALQSGYNNTVGILKTVAALAGKDVTDEQAIVQGVLAGLNAADPQQTADALKAVLGDRAAEVGRLLAGVE